MKYIRTKEDKIYIINKDRFLEDTYYFTNKEGVATIFIEEKNLHILGKQADTIEELCDEFVYHLKSGGKFIDDKLSKSDIYENVFGAIWCEYGLKYVAKLNKKGQLQLCI